MPTGLDVAFAEVVFAEVAFPEGVRPTGVVLLSSITVASAMSTSGSEDSDGAGAVGTGSASFCVLSRVASDVTSANGFSLSLASSAPESNCCQSSAGSSTSASKSAAARQLGQVKMGHDGPISNSRMHLKCQVWLQGATKSDWQGWKLTWLASMVRPDLATL